MLPPPWRLELEQQCLICGEETETISMNVADIKPAKIKINEHKTAEDQVQEVLKSLRPVLPIKFETKQVSIKLPSNFAAKLYPILTSYGDIEKDDWLNDGSWLGVLKIPAGLQNELFDKLNSQTHGDVEINIIR